MKPESLLGIALELIERLEEPGNYPADARAGRLFREKRFLGSRDRRFVGDAAYSWLRHGLRARQRWRTRAASRGLEDSGTPVPASGGTEASIPPGRGTLLADVLILARDGLFPWSFEETLAAARLLPHPALPACVLAEAWAANTGWPEDPGDRLAAELSLPRWLADRLVAERGEDETRRLALSLLEPAPVDLRVNLRKVDRARARERVEEEVGIPVTLAPLSPLGLRLTRRQNLAGTTAAREGWIEVEDEGSQIIALSVEARPGTTVIDACAGAGGKTLALADLLFHEERGGGTSSAGSSSPPTRLIACDTAPRRLDELSRRARLAGVEPRIRIVPLAREGPLPQDLPPADLVVVDAPCSGFGTLRRSPDLKLRYGPGDVTAFARTQRTILERFVPLVKPGGRIAYVTCSVLAEENEEIAASFGAAHPELEEWVPGWARTHLPPGCFCGACVRLDPVRTGTDGFFLAVWRSRQHRKGLESVHAREH